VKVTVMSVDLERGRIGLTMRSGAASGKREQRTGNREPKTGNSGSVRRPGAREQEKPKPAAKPTVPKPGTIAPNGMRFR